MSGSAPKSKAGELTFEVLEDGDDVLIGEKAIESALLLRGLAELLGVLGRAISGGWRELRSKLTGWEFPYEKPSTHAAKSPLRFLGAVTPAMSSSRRSKAASTLRTRFPHPSGQPVITAVTRPAESVRGRMVPSLVRGSG